MKLTKLEVETLVQSVKDYNRKFYERRNKEIRKNPKYQSEVKKIEKIIKEIPKDIRMMLYYNANPDRARILDKVIEPHLERDCTDYKKLERDIILACIESKNLNELKNNLGLSF